MNRYQHKIRTKLARYFPRWLWRPYIQQAEQMGLKQLYLILSFDCDTPEDIEAANQIDLWLRERGIKATYAVPGQNLEQGAQVYRRLADDGAEFINHGALPHAEWRVDRYWSITWYHEMQPHEVIEDIQRGHDIVSRVIGRPPVGFRAPHFGLFQAKEQLALQYDTLNSLGYHYSTSTVPEFAMRHGPIFDVGGLYEIPLSGSYQFCLNILDSWGNIITPQQPVLTDRYANLFMQTVDRLLALNIPGVLNYYVDPAHVYKNDVFFRAISYAVERGIPTLHYSDLLKLVENVKQPIPIGEQPIRQAQGEG